MINRIYILVLDMYIHDMMAYICTHEQLVVLERKLSADAEVLIYC